MRKTFLMMAVALGALTACEKVAFPEMGGGKNEVTEVTKKFTFA